MFWGLTPALDLQEEFKTSDYDAVNILIVGGADARHVLQTIAKRYRHKPVQLNFYLIEACVENVAKQLLLLNVALQPASALGLNQRTKLFMELYGNTMVRPAVAKYLGSTAGDLIKMVTDYGYLHKKMPFIKLDIKYRERDYLENLLKFWCGKDDFNICDCWDRRLRKMLGTRYDSKMGAFDWDLHMRLHSVGGTQVCNQEYKNFRLNGIAFKWLESEVSKPNRSMICALAPNGVSFIHHGYLGDMETGPFITFGLTSEDKDLLKSNNGRNLYRATDVTERNLKQIFHELLEQNEYVHENLMEHHMGAIVIKEDKLVVDIKAIDVITKATANCIDLENVKVTYQSISSLKIMEYSEDYREFFDLIYFGNSYVKHLNQEMLQNTSKPQTLLMIENEIFVLSKRKKDLEEFHQSVQNKLDNLKWHHDPFNPEKDHYMKYYKN